MPQIICKVFESSKYTTLLYVKFVQKNILIEMIDLKHLVVGLDKH